MHNSKQRLLTISFFIISLCILLGLLFVVGTANPVVKFTDEKLEQHVREILDRPTKPIYKTDLKPIMKLDLSGYGIASIEGLRYFSNLTELNLDENYVEEIDDLLYLTRLTKLSLKNNFVSDLSPLASLYRLRSLDLRNNIISDINALKKLKNLEKLNLRENYIESIQPLSDLKRLTYLNLHSNAYVETIRPIADLVGLKTLILKDINVGDDAFILESMTQLETVNLRNCGLKNEALTVIGALPSIMKLDLSSNHLTDIAPLQDLKSLEELYLCEVDITNIEPLAELTDLTYLNLQPHSHIESVKPLNQLINLQTLLLSNINLQNQLDFLRHMDHIESLSLIHCGIQNDDLFAIGERSHIRQLNLSGNPFCDIEPLKTMVHLDELELQGSVIKSVAPLSHLKSLKYLSLHSYSKIDSIKPLSKLTNLQALRLRNIEVSGHMKIIQPMEKLTHLELRSCGVTNTDLAALESLKFLSKLNLRENNISSIQPLKSLENLEELNLRDNQIITIDPVLELKNLKYLNLQSNPRIISLKPLSMLENMETLIVSDVHVRNDMDVFEPMKKLTHLNLRNCGVTDSDLSAIKDLRFIREVDLRKNCITNVEPLENMIFMQALNLSENNIESILPLNGMSSLVYLNLDSNHEIESIAPLTELKNLETLVISNVIIGDSVRYLEELRKLKSINLKNTMISDIEVLAGMTGLEALDISDNIISDITPLSDMKKLSVLDIRNNQICDFAPIGSLESLDLLELRDHQINESWNDPLLTKGIPDVYIYTDNIKIESKTERIDGYMIIKNSLDSQYDNDSLYEGQIGIRGRGYSSWSVGPKKSYNIELKEGQKNKQSKILGMPANEDWLLIGSFSDKSLMRNYIAFDLSNRIGFYAPRARFVYVYLNGQDIGLYLLTERIKRDPHRVDLIKNQDDDDTDVSFLLEISPHDRVYDKAYFSSLQESIFYEYKYPRGENITDTQQAFIQKYIYEYESVLYGEQFDDPYNGYQQYIDTDSFIDWILINELARNNDAVFYASVFITKDIGGKLKMGPVWDFDIAFGNIDYNDNWLTDGWYITAQTRWITRLLEDPYFCEKLKERWREISPVVKGIPDRIDETARFLKESAEKNFNVWPILGEYIWPNCMPYPDSYEGEIERLKNWIIDRTSWIDNNIGNIYHDLNQ